MLTQGCTGPRSWTNTVVLLSRRRLEVSVTTKDPQRDTTWPGLLFKLSLDDKSNFGSASTTPRKTSSEHLSCVLRLAPARPSGNHSPCPSLGETSRWFIACPPC